MAVVISRKNGCYGLKINRKGYVFNISCSHDFSGSLTSDQVTVFKVQASRLVALNSKLIGIKVGDFR